MARRRVKRKRVVKRKRGRVAKATKFSKAIQALRYMKPNQRYNVIRNANDKFIRDMVSHVKKLRTKKLPPKFQNTLKRYSTKLRMISSPKISLQRKRNTLSQKGGFLPALLPILGPIAGAVLGGIFGRN